MPATRATLVVLVAMSVVVAVVLLAADAPAEWALVGVPLVLAALLADDLLRWVRARRGSAERAEAAADAAPHSLPNRSAEILFGARARDQLRASGLDVANAVTATLEQIVAGSLHQVRAVPTRGNWFLVPVGDYRVLFRWLSTEEIKQHGGRLLVAWVGTIQALDQALGRTVGSPASEDDIEALLPTERDWDRFLAEVLGSADEAKAF